MLLTRKSKSTINLILAVLLAASLFAGCGKENETKDSNNVSGAGSTKTQAGTAVSVVPGEKEEKITISLWVPYNVSKSFNITGKEYDWIKTNKEIEYLSSLGKKAGEWPIIDPGWGIRGYSEMRSAMYPELQMMFINKATPEETVKNISTKFNEIIKKYNQ